MTDYCISCLYEDYDGAEEPCINCVRAKDEKPTEYFPKKPPKPITNADRIRAMTDEELAEFMKPYDSGCPRWGGKEPIPCSQRSNCRDCWLDWLKAPVEVDK